ncbi:MAG: hypothetical protein K8R67_16445 [Desulfobacteraceae bacterium]|nr:hypothetical protein [Desulfobacteraceae bacterium]
MGCSKRIDNVVSGIVSGINACCQAFNFSEKGSPKIAPTLPIYPPFLAAPENSGNKLVTIPLIEKTRG